MFFLIAASKILSIKADKQNPPPTHQKRRYPAPKKKERNKQTS